MVDPGVVLKSHVSPGPASASHSYAGAVDGHFLRHNIDVAWEGFDSQAYYEHNYKTLRQEDDAQIIEIVGRFFGDFDHKPVEERSALDVGTGSNLYPALGMLPWSDHITLAEYAPTNVAWLREAVAHDAADDSEWAWEEFWTAYRQHPAYRGVRDPRAKLANVSKICQASVLDLEPHRWDLGTMFFVAESMTSYETEFEDATEHFLSALKPGSPFAAAFMAGSHGYVVADKSFPAVRQVDEEHVDRVLRGFDAKASVQKINVDLDPLRDGYDGMIVAVGTTAQA